VGGRAGVRACVGRVGRGRQSSVGSGEVVERARCPISESGLAGPHNSAPAPLKLRNGTLLGICTIRRPRLRARPGTAPNWTANAWQAHGTARLPARLARLAMPLMSIQYACSALSGPPGPRRAAAAPKGAVHGATDLQRGPRPPCLAPPAYPIRALPCGSWAALRWPLPRRALLVPCPVPPGTRRPQSCSLARPVPTGIVLCTLANR
jgi:hypothetical protein